MTSSKQNADPADRATLLKSRRIQMKPFDVVRLKQDFQGIAAGSEGTIVEKYTGKDFDVEFFDAEGDTIDVITTPASILELVIADIVTDKRTEFKKQSKPN